MFRLLAIALVLVATTASAQIFDDDLTVTTVDPIPCVNPDWVQSGKQVRIQMSGFAASASVTLGWLNVDDQFVEQMVSETINADSGGVVNVVRAVPTSLGTTQPGNTAYISLMGPGANQYQNSTTVIRIIPATTSDGDSDGIADSCDSCPALANAGNQADDDEDLIGNLCDACPDDPINDIDGDGLCGDVDVCPRDAENDADGDGVCEELDNCPVTSNPNQIDTDNNRVGDACQTLPDCSDTVDNDLDGRIDHPDDPGCTSPTDTSERDPNAMCDDGIDNDGDGKIDVIAILDEISGIPVAIGFGGDPGCGNNPEGAKEDPQCQNGIDDDMDTFVDSRPSFRFGTTEDPECPFPAWDSELVPEPSTAAGTLAALFALGVFGVKRRG